MSLLIGKPSFPLTIACCSLLVQLQSAELAPAWAVSNAPSKNPAPGAVKEKFNESQDRLIKKKTFKLKDLTDLPPVSNQGIGLFALLDNRELEDDSLIEQLLSRPEVNGLSALLTWSKLEPAEDSYNWQSIDHILDLAARHHKSVILRISAAGSNDSQANDTPQWVFDNHVKSIAYKNSKGEEHLLPIFWDASYLASWSNFINALGARYDKNPALHSVGISGGGVGGGTSIFPLEGSTDNDQAQISRLSQALQKDYGMNQHQLIEHWKYTADIFPKAFPTARLNFNIDPPTPDRAGQEALDQIVDYLIYRYGQRIYLSRHNVTDAQNGYDQYRLILKFNGDTLTGLRLAPGISPDTLESLTQLALDDGVSFAEIPATLLISSNPEVSKTLQHLASHIGYQLLAKNVNIPHQLKSGESLKASFTFVNLGAASPTCAKRDLDKDIASSYKVQLEIRDSSGKSMVLSRHTPSFPTNHWTAGKDINFESNFNLPHLPPGEYTVWMSLIDLSGQQRVNLLDGINQKQKPPAEDSIALGNLTIGGGSNIGATIEPQSTH